MTSANGDILHGVYYLREQMHKFAKVPEQVLAEVLEHNITEFNEQDLHGLVPIVTQQLGENGQYHSMGAGDIDIAIRGLEAIPKDDPKHLPMSRIRGLELREAVQATHNLLPGQVLVAASLSPTSSEMDPDLATSYGYDGRTMLRLQWKSPDNRTKYMASYTVFDIPLEAWSASLSDRFDLPAKPKTAKDVLEISLEHGVSEGTHQEVARQYFSDLEEYLNEDDRDSLRLQIEKFEEDQQRLSEIASYYAHEKLLFEVELARSIEFASEELEDFVGREYQLLDQEHQAIVDTHYVDGKLKMSRELEELMLTMKSITLFKRAGLAARNPKTVQDLADNVGLERVQQLAISEDQIRGFNLDQIQAQDLQSKNEAEIAASGVDCEGGCAVSLESPYSQGVSEAKKAGLSGEVYSWKDAKCPGCNGAKRGKVYVDNQGSKFCQSCGEFSIKGRRGNSFKDSK